MVAPGVRPGCAWCTVDWAVGVPDLPILVKPPTAAAVAKPPTMGLCKPPTMGLCTTSAPTGTTGAAWATAPQTAAVGSALGGSFSVGASAAVLTVAPARKAHGGRRSWLGSHRPPGPACGLASAFDGPGSGAGLGAADLPLFKRQARARALDASADP